MTTSPLVTGTRVASIALVTLVTTAVSTALVGAVVAGIGGGPAGSPGTTSVRAAATASPTAPATRAQGLTAPSSAAPSAVTRTGGQAATTVPFRWTVHRVTRAYLGTSWRSGCPVGPSSLRLLRFTHHTFDGGTATGRIVLHRDTVKRARTAFADLYDLGFPLRRVQPVTAYGASDDRSMAADNTSAFNCRKVTGSTSSWSKHAYGRAIDVNPVENPYVRSGKVLPPGGKAYRDRSTARKGLIRRGDAAYDAFTDAGFRWGGAWRSPDYQHFER